MIAGNIVDFPTAGPEGEHVTNSRFVDHFFIELTDAPRPSVGCGAAEKHPEHAAVRDGATVGHRHALATRAAFQHAGHAVEHNPGTQFRKIRRGVGAGHQVDDCVESLARQLGVGVRSPHNLEPLVHMPIPQSNCRHGVLRQNIQRVAGHAELLNLAAQHACNRHRSVHNISSVLRVEHTAGGITHVVPGATDALQPCRHRRWGFDLDDQIHGPHVDAQF